MGLPLTLNMLLYVARGKQKNGMPKMLEHLEISGRSLT